MASSRRLGAGLRPWIATAAAYLFLIQSILAGVALGHIAASATGAQHPIVICLGSGPASDPGAPDTQPVRMSPCVLCAATLAAAALADNGGPGVPLQLSDAVLPATYAAILTPSVRHSPRQSQGPPLLV
jgi:hypothetical protein